MDAERRRCAARLSFWLPGLGQLYLRRWWTGAALVAASWIGSDLTWRHCSVPWAIATAAVWVIAVRSAGGNA